MSAEARWVRLNVDWHESEWLAELPWQVRAAWPLLLTHVKVHGQNGVCREPILKRFCATYDVPEKCITALRNAALQSGALRIEDGNWILANWALYQREDRTNADRQKRHRERKKAPSQVQNEEDNDPITEHNAPVTALRNATGTETKTVITSKDVMGASAPEHPKRPVLFRKPSPEQVVAYFREKGSSGQEARKFWDYYQANGWKVGRVPMKDWQAASRGWIARNQDQTRPAPVASAAPVRTREELEAMTR